MFTGTASTTGTRKTYNPRWYTPHLVVGDEVYISSLMLTEGTEPAEWSLAASELVGTGVSAITPQYYLSSSSTTQTGGSWVETCPAWSTGKYIWTRSKCDWTDGTTTYTTPVLDNALNGLGQRVVTVEQTAEAVETKVATLEGDVETQATLIRQSGNGVEVARKVSGSYTSTRTLMSDTGFTVYAKDGTQLAKYGSDSVIGIPNKGNVHIDSDSVDLRTGSTVLASFYADGAKTNILSANDLYFFAGTAASPNSVYFTLPPGTDGYETDQGFGILPDGEYCKIYGLGTKAEFFVDSDFCVNNVPLNKKLVWVFAMYPRGNTTLGSTMSTTGWRGVSLGTLQDGCSVDYSDYLELHDGGADSSWFVLKKPGIWRCVNGETISTASGTSRAGCGWFSSSGTELQSNFGYAGGTVICPVCDMTISSDGTQTVQPKCLVGKTGWKRYLGAQCTFKQLEYLGEA